MRRSLGNLGLATLFSIIGSAMLIVWLLTDATQSDLDQSTLEYQESGISALNLEARNNSILLNIKLSKPMTCENIFLALDIEEIPIRGRVYSPSCTTVSPDLVVVTYKEKISV